MFTEEQLKHFKTKQVFIHTHDFPDPDAFASAFGIQELLSNYGIDSLICYGGELERTNLIKMLDEFHISVAHRSRYESPKDSGIPSFDRAVNILVDSQLNNSNMGLNHVEDVYCIDHHPTFRDAEYVWSDIRLVGACSSIVISYFMEAGITPSRDAASALCYGLKMDTNDFNRGATQFDIDMFARIFQYCDYDTVTLMNQNQLILNDFEAFSAAIRSITTHGTVGFAYIPFQCPSTLVAIISDFILSTEEVEVSIVYSKLDDVVKFSVRSENPNIAAGILTHNALDGIGNGGGHPTMAGGIIYKKYLDEMEDVSREIEKRFMEAFEAMSGE